MVLLIYMEDGDTMDFHHGDAPEQSVKDNAAFRLMSVIAERDAAILERNTALAEKKAAYAERDAALLQRDVAYADRNAALSERDAAIAALDQIRDGSMNDPGCLSCRTVSGTKLLQVLCENQNIQPVNVAFPSQALDIPTGQPQKQTKLAFKKKDRQKVSASKRKSDGSTPKTSMPLKPRTQAATLGEESKEQLTVIKHEQNDQTLGNSGIVFETLPIPVCSCTGVPHQCYRWGTGGWQSACCTTTISMYPLPMNPNKRGARMAGRKMSGGAFMKVLQRLSVEGHTLSCPIDLKNYWARHGTNRFVTIS